MQDSKVNERSNIRTSVRHICPDLNAKMKAGSGDYNVVVNDISLDGIGVYCNNELPQETESVRKIKLVSDKYGESDFINAYCVGKSEKEIAGKKYCNLHLKFTKPQRPEKLGAFNLFFSAPSSCSKSTKQRFELQKIIAEKDIEALENSIGHLKSCQFQLVLASMPILFGILATLISFVAGEITEKVHSLYYFLPPVSVFLSLTFLAVFIQKTEAIRRATAFSLILQRHLAMGSFPPCYRGWHDAYENYNHYIRHGAEERSVFDVHEFEEKGIKHHVPADSFTWLSLSLFSFIPLISMVLMFLVLEDQISKDVEGIRVYGIIVGAVTGIFIGSLYWIYKKFKALSNGKRSFRYLVVLFSKILKYAPPFDPYNNNPINIHPNLHESSGSLHNNTQQPAACRDSLA